MCTSVVGVFCHFLKKKLQTPRHSALVALLAFFEKTTNATSFGFGFIAYLMLASKD